MAKERTRSMTEGSPIKLIISFSLPLMLGNIFQQLYTTVDTLVVGRGLGVQALAAVGNADWMNWTILGTVTGFTQGFSILMAQRFGAKDEDGLRKTVASSVVLSLLIAVIAVIISQAATVPALRALKSPEEIIPTSTAYLRIIFAGIPLVLLYNLLASILRALGDGKTPLYAMIVASLINVCLDLVFVLGLHWGVMGAAAGTVIAQTCSGIYCFMALKKIPMLKLRREDFIPDFAGHLALLRLGAPMAFQNCVIAIGGMFVQAVINGFGVLFIAGYTATNKMYGLLELAGVSFGYAMVTYVGQNVGAGKLERISEGMRAAIKVSILISGTICVLMFLLGRPILRCFLTGEASQVETALNIGYYYLVVMSICLPVLYALHVTRSALQGMGDTVLPMVSGFVELIMRCASAAILPVLFGPYGVLWAENAAWIGADVVLFTSYYVRMKQLKANGSITIRGRR